MTYNRNFAPRLREFDPDRVAVLLDLIEAIERERPGLDDDALLQAGIDEYVAEYGGDEEDCDPTPWYYRNTAGRPACVE